MRAPPPLAELVADMKVFPQEIKNVQVREKPPFEQLPAVMEAIAAAESELDGKGRVVVRYSGTEKLARVMIEAESERNYAPSYRCHRGKYESKPELEGICRSTAARDSQ